MFVISTLRGKNANDFALILAKTFGFLSNILAKIIILPQTFFLCVESFLPLPPKSHIYLSN